MKAFVLLTVVFLFVCAGGNLNEFANFKDIKPWKPEHQLTPMIMFLLLLVYALWGIKILLE